MNLTLLSASLMSLTAAAPQDCPSKAPRATLASHAAVGGDIVDTALAAGDFGTLAAALQAAGLVETLKGKGPFTVFAPTDAAFAALPKGTLEDLLEPENEATLTAILTYHVAAGQFPASQVTKSTFLSTVNGQRVDVELDEKTGEVRIDGAKVQKADIRCSNGIIHVIDRVILPSTDDLLETAAAAGGFDTLSAAIEAAGLVEALQAKGPYTVFAPTDAAFAALPEGTLEGLLKPESRDHLVSILKLHVVAGRVYSDQVLEAGRARTLSGGELLFRADDHRVYVGDARIVKPDIEAKNGVIHVIDSVLLPE